MPLTSPYNFVPINSKVYYPWWGNCISSDIPFKDGEDGYIEVTFKNVSPLFTRNGSRQEKDKRDTPKDSSYIEEENGDRRYFIPGTAIKGMLRATLEIMAFGKISERQHYTNRWFGYRDIGGNSQYRATVAKGKPGWLSKDPNDKYHFEPCERFDQIEIEELKKLYRDYDDTLKSVWRTNCSLMGKGCKKPQYPIYKKDGAEYRIVCTGSMKGGKTEKTHELLFTTELGNAIDVSEETVHAFFTVYETSPDFENFKQELDKGEKIPVFLLANAKMPVNPILGMSRMFKLPYKYSISDLIDNEQNGVKPERDLCETMFGTVADEMNVKGRIQVGHAFATTVNSPLMGEVSGVLGQPKASYYPLYIKQNAGNPYKNYDSGTAMSGRKIYRIHRADTTTDLPTGNDDPNVTTSFNALAPGQTFKMRINVHNLKRVEMGALLSALTLHETPGVYHNIGLAKSFGYGKLKVESITLNRFKYHDRQVYEMAFEDEMNVFLKMKWRDTEQVRRLMSILGEHDDKVLKVMELEEYGSAKKKNAKIELLSEVPIPVNSLAGPIEDFRSQHGAYMDRIKQLERENMLDEALQEIDKLIGLFEERQLSHSVETNMREKILDAINQHEKEIEEQEMEAQRERQLQAKRDEAQRQQIEAKRQEKLKAGLAALLDETFGDGTYKVTTLKTCFSKVGDWLKKSGRTELLNEEKEDLKRTVERIVHSPDKKEMRDLKKFNSKQWKDVATHLGEDIASKLYKMLP